MFTASPFLLLVLALVHLSVQQSSYNYFEYNALRKRSEASEESKTITYHHSVDDPLYFSPSTYITHGSTKTIFVPYTNGIPVTGPGPVSYQHATTTSSSSVSVITVVGNPLYFSETVITSGNSTSTSLVPFIIHPSKSLAGITITEEAVTSVAASARSSSYVTSTASVSFTYSVDDPLYFVPSTVINNSTTYTTYIPYTNGIPVTPYSLLSTAS